MGTCCAAQDRKLDNKEANLEIPPIEENAQEEHASKPEAEAEEEKKIDYEAEFMENVAKIKSKNEEVKVAIAT